jgi:hypothetical protein
MSAPITGTAALLVARLFHLLGWDSPGQWGCAYFLCPECKAARDCTGKENWDTDSVEWCRGEWRDEPCDHVFEIADLRISEGFVERDLPRLLSAASNSHATTVEALRDVRDHILRPMRGEWPGTMSITARQVTEQIDAALATAGEPSPEGTTT